MTAEQSEFFECLESGMTVTQACRQTGTQRTEFYAWLKDDKAFFERVSHSNVADIVTMDDITFVKGMGGNAQDRRLFYERRLDQSPPVPAGIASELARIRRQK